VTLVQSSLYWENVEKNLEEFSLKLAGSKNTTDLIVLPETFNTGFSMSPEGLAEEKGGRSTQWLADTAADLGCDVAGSLIFFEAGCYFNRLIWMRPDGSFDYYDKRHLFRMLDEHTYFTAGQERKIVALKGWRFCLQICYDLRFPVWSRNRDDYDVLLYIANWPEPRRDAWGSLLVARAIENQAYVIGVNRVGEDGNGLTFSGDSAAIDSRGRIMSHIQPHREEIETVTLSWTELQDFREKFQVHLDADRFKLE
jgi:predicted amidohydrolase